LIDRWGKDGRKLHVTVFNRSAEDFNRRIYCGRPVDVQPVDSLVRLSKVEGEVHVPKTLDTLQRYAESRTSYAEETGRRIKDCDIAIDIGVPLFTRTASDLGVPHRITLFDHSWAATLRLITSDEWKHVYRSNPPPGPVERKKAEAIAGLLEEDEACATDVFLFPEYITPEEFVAHWVRLGFSPRILPGLLGMRVSRAEARAKLESTLREYGQTSLPYKPLVLLSPGGTPVWKKELPRLLEEVLCSPEQSYVLVLSTDLSKLPDVQPNLKERILASDRIRYYGPVKGATQLAVLPAFDLVITRAGGGTVNDALVAGVRLAFVEEPQVQVKLIERECIKLGLSCAPATLAEFRNAPKACIDRLVEPPVLKPKVTPVGGAEKAVVEHIVKLLA
jgi:hypothetical protein